MKYLTYDEMDDNQRRSLVTATLSYQDATDANLAERRSEFLATLKALETVFTARFGAPKPGETYYFAGKWEIAKAGLVGNHLIRVP